MVIEEKTNQEEPSMDHYHHLTIEQRENLLVCVNQGKKYAEIAAEIHCSESTVSREIRRNSASRQEYSAIKAQRAYAPIFRCSASSAFPEGANLRKLCFRALHEMRAIRHGPQTIF